MRTDGECEDNEKECAVYICLSVLVDLRPLPDRKRSQMGISEI